MKALLIACASCAALTAGTASAQTMTFFGYHLSASLQAASAPSWQGSKYYSVFPSGNIALTKPWQFDDFYAQDDSASFALVNTRIVQFGIAAAVIDNRGNNKGLQGMRNIGYAGEGGGFVNIWPTPWMRVRVEALKGLVSEDGLLINTGADFVTHPGKFTLSAGPRFSWADDHYMGTYFGVTPGEALASPRFNAAYTARGGPLSAGIEAGVEYKLLSRWRLTLHGDYDRLLDHAASSPIVRQGGTPDQASVAAGLRFMLN
ncbi:MAG TPA: MipA/OmpV family protein [Caulobacteraceae bacterium]|nr:MipA/OmpV family protein [Caulobacteraceae bacterium]